MCTPAARRVCPGQVVVWEIHVNAKRKQSSLEFSSRSCQYGGVARSVPGRFVSLCQLAILTVRRVPPRQGHVLQAHTETAPASAGLAVTLANGHDFFGNLAPCYIERRYFWGTMKIVDFSLLRKSSFARGFLKGLGAPYVLFGSFDVGIEIPAVDPVIPSTGLNQGSAGDWNRIGKDMRTAIRLYEQKSTT